MSELTAEKEWIKVLGALFKRCLEETADSVALVWYGVHYNQKYKRKLKRKLKRRIK